MQQSINLIFVGVYKDINVWYDIYAKTYSAQLNIKFLVESIYLQNMFDTISSYKCPNLN